MSFPPLRQMLSFQNGVSESTEEDSAPLTVSHQTISLLTAAFDQWSDLLAQLVKQSEAYRTDTHQIQKFEHQVERNQTRLTAYKEIASVVLELRAPQVLAGNSERADLTIEMVEICERKRLLEAQHMALRESVKRTQGRMDLLCSAKELGHNLNQARILVYRGVVATMLQWRDAYEPQDDVAVQALQVEILQLREQECSLMAEREMLLASRVTARENLTNARSARRYQHASTRRVRKCPKRAGDVGDYLLRINCDEARDKIQSVRDAFIEAIETRRKEGYWQVIRPWVNAVRQTAGVSATATARQQPANKSRTLRTHLHAMRRTTLLPFAKANLSRAESSRRVHEEARKKGRARKGVEYLYDGSERQSDARRIHTGAVRRLFRHIVSENYSPASYHFSPFYLDLHQDKSIAKLICASDEVAERLLNGCALSHALAFKGASAFNWRNRGPYGHAMFAYKKGYCPSDCQLTQMGKRYLVALGVTLNRFRFAFIKHEDSDHVHVHLVWSRIRDDGGVISHPAYTRDRVCQLIGAVQDLIVLGQSPRDALGGVSWACRAGDELMDRDAMVATIKLCDGSREVIPLQGSEAAKRIAALGWLEVECLGGVGKVMKYWGENTARDDGTSMDEYLTRTLMATAA